MGISLFVCLVMCVVLSIPVVVRGVCYLVEQGQYDYWYYEAYNLRQQGELLDWDKERVRVMRYYEAKATEATKEVIEQEREVYAQALLLLDQ